jgi:hypothetical protein
VIGNGEYEISWRFAQGGCLMAVVTVARRVEEAKAPVSSVAGPYGHPFHPILVTVPIGACVASVVFDVASNVTSGGSAALVEGAC